MSILEVNRPWSNEIKERVGEDKYQKLIDTIQLTIEEAGGSTTIIDIPISGIIIPTSGGG